MSAQGFVLGANEMSKLNAGDAMPLNGTGVTVVTAFEPTLLDLYRQDPVAVREQVRCRARRARSEDIGAFFARLFC